MTFCRHRHKTTPRSDAQGDYERCLDCGRRLPWSWADSMQIAPPTRTQQGKDRSADRSASELERIVGH